MKIKALILDFGFTLFYFKEVTLEKYLDSYKNGLNNALDSLKKGRILVDESSLRKFKSIFNKKRSNYFKDSLKSNREYPTAMIFKQTIQDLIQDGTIDKKIKEKILNKEFLNHLADLYHSFELKEWLPFKHTRETLEKLKTIKGLKLVVLSNHPHHPTIINILKSHNLLNFFDHVQTSARFGKRKPAPEIFLNVLEKLGLENEPSSCIICGDEHADIVGGHRSGLKTILCERDYTFPFEKEINVPNVIKIKKISEILQLLID